MRQGIPEETVDEIRQRADIVSLVGEYITLEKKGRNMVGLCPFHGEKTPSFTVSPEKQLFHCFGCGASGNIFSFVMKLENMSFPEAARFLAQRSGIKIPERRPERGSGDGLKEQIFALNQLAASFYAYHLRESAAGKKAAQYLRERGITAPSSELFMLGYAPPGWENFSGFAREKDFKPELLLKSGLVSPREGKEGFYDRFRHRLIFPIFNLSGKISGFGGRALDEGEKTGPKYLNSPETAVFEKGAVLYGLHLAREQIRREKKAVVVEGYTDVISAFQCGLKNVVASLGTALTAAQARLLRAQAEKVVIAYDADRAGEAAAWRGLKILSDAGCLVQVADLPAGSDPDSLIREKGADVFRELVQNARPLVEHQLDTLKKRCDPASEEGRLHYMTEAVSLLGSLSSLVEQDFYLKRMAEELGISEAALRGELRRKRGKPGVVHNLSLKDQTNNINQIKVNRAEKMLVSLMIQGEGLSGLARSELQPEDLESEPVRQVVEVIWNLESAGDPVSGEGLINLFKDTNIHTLITGAATDPSLQDLPRETMERMTRDCIHKIKENKLARRQQLGQQRLKEKDMEKQLDEQAKNLLREQQETIQRIKCSPYRSGGGEDFSG